MSRHSGDTRVFQMTDFDTPEDDVLSAAIVKALEAPPAAVDVPFDFASRVMRLAVAQPAPPRSVWAGFGPRIALASGLLLLIALFAFAAHANPSFSNLRFDLELLLLLELGAVSLLVPHLASRE